MTSCANTLSDWRFFFPLDCNSALELRAALGVQGTLRTPFFPRYYPPDTNCTWTFTVRHLFQIYSRCCYRVHFSAFNCVRVISDARRGDGLVSWIWGIWIEQSWIQPGLYTRTVDNPEPQVPVGPDSALMVRLTGSVRLFEATWYNPTQVHLLSNPDHHLFSRTLKCHLKKFRCQKHCQGDRWFCLTSLAADL